MSDRQGIPLTSLQTAANVNECTVLMDVIDAIPLITHPDGPPRQRPDTLHADKAYDSGDRRAGLEQRNIITRTPALGHRARFRLVASKPPSPRPL